MPYCLKFWHICIVDYHTPFVVDLIQLLMDIKGLIHVVTSKLPSTQNILLPSCVVASALILYLPSGTVCGLNGIGGELMSA